MNPHVAACLPAYFRAFALLIFLFQREQVRSTRARSLLTLFTYLSLCLYTFFLICLPPFHIPSFPTTYPASERGRNKWRRRRNKKMNKNKKRDKEEQKEQTQRRTRGRNRRIWKTPPPSPPSICLAAVEPTGRGEGDALCKLYIATHTKQSMGNSVTGPRL